MNTYYTQGMRQWNQSACVLLSLRDKIKEAGRGQILESVIQI